MSPGPKRSVVLSCSAPTPPPVSDVTMTPRGVVRVEEQVGVHLAVGDAEGAHIGVRHFDAHAAAGAVDQQPGTVDLADEIPDLIGVFRDQYTSHGTWLSAHLCLRSV